MRDFFRREFAPIGTDDEDGPVELLESRRMYRAGLRENAKAGQAADDKPEKHSNKKRADKTGTQTNVYRTDNTIDSGKATRRGARPANAAHHGGFISVSPALIALCALAPLLGQGRLMAMTLGESLFLNPKLPSGKEFTPREISHLLGEEGSPLSTQTVLEGGEALLLSEVADPPAQMVDSLTTLFKTLKTVKRAFLCSIKESADAPANLLIGIEAEGDIESIIQTTGSVATDTLPGDEPIDICQVVEGEKGISHFMIAHITPFYEKRWGSFLRDFKQNRII